MEGERERIFSHPLWFCSIQTCCGLGDALPVWREPPASFNLSIQMLLSYSNTLRDTPTKCLTRYLGNPGKLTRDIDHHSAYSQPFVHFFVTCVLNTMAQLVFWRRQRFFNIINPSSETKLWVFFPPKMLNIAINNKIFSPNIFTGNVLFASLWKTFLWQIFLPHKTYQMNDLSLRFLLIFHHI